jgi:hypothetical protein
MTNRRFIAILIALGLIAVACASAAPNPPIPQRTDTPPIPTEIVPTAIPITPTYEGCAYMWGSQQLPTLSSKLNAALQQISTDATGLAYAYGENCVYADGHQTFSAMETDYRVGVKVVSVHDEAALGDWIYKVMQVILALPADEIQGPQSGRVDFDFKQPDPAEVMLTVPIDKYRTEAAGLRGAELFRYFYTNP